MGLAGSRRSGCKSLRTASHGSQLLPGTGRRIQAPDAEFEHLYAVVQAFHAKIFSPSVYGNDPAYTNHGIEISTTDLMEKLLVPNVAKTLLALNSMAANLDDTQIMTQRPEFETKEAIKFAKVIWSHRL